MTINTWQNVPKHSLFKQYNFHDKINEQYFAKGLNVTRYRKRYLTTLSTSYWFGINTIQSEARSSLLKSKCSIK